MRYILALLVLGSALVVAPAWCAGHQPGDYVPEGHWSYAAFRYLDEIGVLDNSGYPPDFFSGEKSLTRYDMRAAASRAFYEVSGKRAAYPAHAIAMVSDLLVEYADQREYINYTLAEPVYDPKSTEYFKVPPGDWAWEAKQRLIDEGVIGERTLVPNPFGMNSRREFAYITMFAAASAYQRNDPELYAIIDRLYFEFRDCLRICAVAPANRQPKEFTPEPLPRPIVAIEPEDG